MDVLWGMAYRAGKSIRLNALRGSRSNAFYRRHGFTQTDEDEWDIYYIWDPSLHSPLGNGADNVAMIVNVLFYIDDKSASITGRREAVTYDG